MRAAIENGMETSNGAMLMLIGSSRKDHIIPLLQGAELERGSQSRASVL